MQIQDHPFQEVDIPLDTPRVIKNYTYDPVKVQQRRFTNFALETVSDEGINNNIKFDNKDKTISGYKTVKQQLNEKKVLSPFEHFGPGGEPEKMKSSLEKQEKTNDKVLALSNNFKTLAKFSTSLSKDDGKTLDISDHFPGQTEDNEGVKKARARLVEAIQGSGYIQKRSYQSKKIIVDSDDEGDIAEVKDIDPLMILAHQNLKPTKYIFNTKYLGEKLSEHDKKFLSHRLPNLFKNKNQNAHRFHTFTSQLAEVKYDEKAEKLEPVIVLANYDQNPDGSLERGADSPSIRKKKRNKSEKH